MAFGTSRGVLQIRCGISVALNLTTHLCRHDTRSKTISSALCSTNIFRVWEIMRLDPAVLNSGMRDKEKVGAVLLNCDMGKLNYGFAAYLA